MKNLTTYIASLLMPLAYTVNAQTDTTSIPDVLVPAQRYVSRAKPIEDDKKIKPYSIELAFNKTTSLIFPSAIRSVDLGSRDIISEKYNDVENVLRIKASQMGFNETNFSVITADGRFHSFIANYNEYPDVVSYDLTGNALTKEASSMPIDQNGVIEFQKVRTTQAEVITNASRVLNKGHNLKGVGVTKYKMEAKIPALYVKDNVMYVKVAIKNKSNINYDMDYIRFFIIDKKQLKLASNQELEIKPLYVYNEPIMQVRGKESVEKVYVFQKFTIPNEKMVEVNIGEINGGRTIPFRFSNDDIMKSGAL